MSDDHKKDAKQVNKELLKEFERGQLNRDEALQELTKRSRRKDESALTYACKISELVKLAYHSIEEQVKEITSKDYFVRGLHPEMQKALKSNEEFSSNDIKALASEAVRLEIAGIKSNSATASQTASHVDCVDFKPPNNMADNALVDQIEERAMEKLRGASIQDGGNSRTPERSEVNLVNPNNNRKRNRRGPPRDQPRQFHQTTGTSLTTSAEPLKVLNTSSETVRFVSVKLVGRGATMLGTVLAPTTNNG